VGARSRGDDIPNVRTILVVEDEETFRELLRSVLEPRGFRVILAENAAQGLELASTQAIDAVVTDYHMPKMNGLQLCRALAGRVPVWVMTGSVNLTQQEVVAAGAVGIFRKPFRVQELCRVVERHFQETATKDQRAP
jgi:CheY-like chemotaxis protein